MTNTTPSLPEDIEAIETTIESNDITESSNDESHMSSVKKPCHKVIKSWAIAFAIMASLLVMNVLFTGYMYWENQTMKSLDSDLVDVRKMIHDVNNDVSILATEVNALNSLEAKVTDWQAELGSQLGDSEKRLGGQIGKVDGLITTISKKIGALNSRLQTLEKTPIPEAVPVKKSVRAKPINVPMISSMRAIGGIPMVTLANDQGETSEILRVNDQWQGWRVKSIQGNTLKISKGKVQRVLEF